MAQTITEEDIRTNYSKVGTRLIEQLYGDDFLSLSGKASSDAMIAAANINASTRVLDVGCGVGGPSLYLAERTGCHVTGVDLIEWHAEEAARRAEQRGLTGNTSFEAGDATQLEFDDASYDVVWSQDAWCHVPDKPRVISEAARVTKRGGYIAFTDWVALGEMEPDYYACVQSAVASPNFATPGEYQQWLAACAVEVSSFVDISQRFVARYESMVGNLTSLRNQVCEQFSERVYNVMQEKNSMILRAFRDGKIGGIQIVAKKL